MRAWVEGLAFALALGALVHFASGCTSTRTPEPDAGCYLDDMRNLWVCPDGDGGTVVACAPWVCHDGGVP